MRLRQLPRPVKNLLCRIGLHVDKNQIGPLDMAPPEKRYQDWCYWCGWRVEYGQPHRQSIYPANRIRAKRGCFRIGGA